MGSIDLRQGKPGDIYPLGRPDALTGDSLQRAAIVDIRVTSSAEFTFRFGSTAGTPRSDRLTRDLPFAGARELRNRRKRIQRLTRVFDVQDSQFGREVDSLLGMTPIETT